MSTQRFAIYLMIAASSIVSTGHADERATAQQLFQEAKALMSAGKIAEACDKFEGASELSPTTGVRLNLANCWAKLGRTASAWAKYDEALVAAERARDDVAAALARKGRTELEPQLSYLSVSVPKEAVVVGLEVLRDGRKLPEAAWGSSVPVDPGEHEVVATAPGRKRWSMKQRVTGAGTRSTLRVPVLVEEDKPVAAPVLAPVVPTAPPQPSDTSDGSGQRSLAWVAGGLGVIGIGVGAYFGLQTKSKKDSYETHRGPDGACLDIDCQSLSQDARSAGNISTIGFIAGGVLAATGIVVWSVAPSKGKEGMTGRLIPVASPSVAGLGMSGCW